MPVEVIWEKHHYQQSSVLDAIQKHLEKTITSYEIVSGEDILMPSGDFARGLFFNRGIRMHGCVISAAARLNFISRSFPRELKREVMIALASPELQMHLLS